MLRPLHDVAADLDIAPAHVLPWGRDRAKIDLAALDGAPKGRGRLVLVSAINPTPAGEGKTTMSVSLAMGLRRRGARVGLALREPSMGPLFGVKGGATGGGKAVVEPGDAINFHFTGDLHAITSAHNLLAAVVDNALHFGTSRLDARRVRWPRVLDMNDRALRHVVVGLGGRSEGVPREARFDITAASEVMAVLCLASSPEDLRARLARMVVGEAADGSVVRAEELGVDGAMAKVLADALMPNLAQTAEGGATFIHGGPFANIAHGCNSLLATRLSLHHADVTVTEAGFGFDLGGLKFLDLKARQGGPWPDALVLVATLRALRMHGGAPVSRAGDPDVDALAKGFANLEHHLDLAASFGLPACVAINVFGGDTEAELRWLEHALAARGVTSARVTAFADGGAGGEALADVVLERLKGPTPQRRTLYDVTQPIPEKLNAIARCWGASGVELTPAATRQAAALATQGLADLPICVARAPSWLSGRAGDVGRPTGFTVEIRELRPSAGAGFIVALAGEISTMPGLPKVPAAAAMQ
jgi:formate--tetrahydrofolate ligase